MAVTDTVTCLAQVWIPVPASMLALISFATQDPGWPWSRYASLQCPLPLGFAGGGLGLRVYSERGLGV